MNLSDTWQRCLRFLSSLSGTFHSAYEGSVSQWPASSSTRTIAGAGRRLRRVRAALLLYPPLLAGLAVGAQTPTSTLDRENGDRQSLSSVHAQAVTTPSCLSILDRQERILTTSADKPYVVPEQTLKIYLKADNCRIPKKPNNNPKPKAVVEGTRNGVTVDKIKIEYSRNHYRSSVLYFVDESAFRRGFYQPASFLAPLSFSGLIKEDGIIKFSINKSYVGETADVLDELFFYVTWAEEEEIKPEVTIAAGTSPVTEGADATFTLTATPTPLPITVTVDVAADGDYGITAGKSTVTIPTTGNATLTLPTTNDSMEEPNGGVEVTVLTGTNYHVAPPPGNSARVSVTDNDDTVAPTVKITGVPTEINSTDAFTAIFTFSEDVTGFEAGDVTVTGGAKGAFASTSARSYTMAVTPTGPADVVMTVAADAATDGFNTGPVSAVSATATWEVPVADNDVAVGNLVVTHDYEKIWSMEEGETRQIKVKLSEAPQGTGVTVTPISVATPPVEHTFSPSSLVFTWNNWNVDQTLDITAYDDNEYTGPSRANIIFEPCRWWIRLCTKLSYSRPYRRK